MTDDEVMGFIIWLYDLEVYHLCEGDNFDASKVSQIRERFMSINDIDAESFGIDREPLDNR